MLSSATDILQTGEKKITTVIVLLLIDLLLDGVETSSSTSNAGQYLDRGRRFLAAGQLSDALLQYHAAIDADPDNYLAYFQRGTVFYALGKARMAINDFSKALELNENFDIARNHRAIVYFKLGEYDKSEEDFIYAGNAADIEIYGRIQPAREQWELVKNMISVNDYSNGRKFLSQLIEISPWCADYRKLRAECCVQTDDVLAAISDLRSVNKLSQDNTEGYYNLAILLYRLGHIVDARNEIKECLKLDPEHKLCLPLYRKIKKIDKAITDAESHIADKKYKKCIDTVQKIVNLENEEDMIRFITKQLLCTCYVGDGQYSNAITHCREALNIRKDPEVLCKRAEAYLETEMYSDAIHDYHDALELDQHIQCAKDGLEKAKMLQKRAEKRDYYKILSVDKTATKQEITKAYRKAAQKWHPDNFQGDEKKIAEKKFIDIAAAKEVLTDPEKRKQYDRGIDPLDPESSQDRDFHNPFQHFQHGSPFQFKFHFN